MAYDDESFQPAALALLTCLSQAVDDLSQPPASVQLRAGAAIALDISQTQNECCDGLAWVREGDIFPSAAFPEADTNAVRCNPVWALELEMGITRCAPVGTIENTPSADEHLAVAVALAEDRSALRRALCCFTAQWPAMVTIGRISPFGPEGGCVGLLATLTVQVIPRDTWPS